MAELGKTHVVVFAILVLCVFILVTRHQHPEGMLTAPPTFPSGQMVQAAQAGGRNAQQGRYPYIVLIKTASGQCTGFLIDSMHVITAGHCVVDKLRKEDRLRNPSEVKMRIGGYRYDGSDGEPRACAKIHSVFNRSSDQNDWAILTLFTPSKKTPIKVDGWNATADLSAGMWVWSVGFGRGYHMRMHRYLQENQLRLSLFSNTVIETRTNERTPGFQSTMRRPCSGDSGGPLFVKGRTASEDVVIGIVSRGKRNRRGHCVGGELKYERVTLALSGVLKRMIKR